MPFKDADIDTHIQGLKGHQREVWLSTANSVLNRCIEQGGSDETCAPRSIRIANNAAKQVKANSTFAITDLVDDEIKEALEDVKTMALETESIKGVEVFAVGKWNGDEYDKADLDEMARNFNELKGRLDPFLKLGHGSKQKLLDNSELPAAGWITRLYRKGEKLLADIGGIPRKLADIIKAGGFRKRSAEIYWDWTEPSSGKKYRRVFKALALLGADAPAVTSLDDIVKSWYEDQAADDRLAAWAYEADEEPLHVYDLDEGHEYATTNKPWDGSAGRFTMEQLMRAVPRSVAAHARAMAKQESRDLVKSDLKLPFKEPDGTINLNGVRAALAAIGGARTGQKPGLPANVLAAARTELQSILESSRPMSDDNGSRVLLAFPYEEETIVRDTTCELSESALNSARVSVTWLPTGSEVSTIDSSEVVSDEEDDMTDKDDAVKKYEAEIEAERKAREDAEKAKDEEAKRYAEEQEKNRKLQERIDKIEHEAAEKEVKAFVDSITSETCMRMNPKSKDLAVYLLMEAPNGEARAYSDGNGEKTYREALQAFMTSLPDFSKGMFKEYSRITEDEEGELKHTTVFDPSHPKESGDKYIQSLSNAAAASK